MPDVPQAAEQTQIPPQLLSALQQQTAGMSGGDITGILAQLAQMSPDEMSQALQQLGVNISPDELVQHAENWIDQAADASAGVEGSAEEEAAESPAQEQQEQDSGGDNSDDAESAPSGSADDATLPPGARPTAQTGEAGQAAEATQAGSPPTQVPNMPSAGRGRMPPSAAMQSAAASGAGTMDDLVSAALMQQAAGNPNANVPLPRTSRPSMPGAPTTLGNMRTPNPANTRSKKRG